MYKYLKTVFLGALLIVGSGCMSANQRAQMAAQSPHPAVRAAAMIAKLAQQGIRVIRVGETVSVIIPADLLFYPSSANLERSSFQRLNSVADFLRLYSKTFVEVVAYSDPTIQAGHLTSQQAAQVMRYLWSKDIDARLLNAIGYGSEQPITNNNFENVSEKNRRVEIHFQYNNY